jgi:hypothetical protein
MDPPCPTSTPIAPTTAYSAFEPGDAIAFNFAPFMATRHRQAAGRRRVFSARWVGDGAVFVDRQGKGSPPFEGPDFPLVFSA